MTDDAVRPFHLAIDEQVLVDLRERLERTRWPERETVRGDAQGVPLAALQALCEHWRLRYDWRRAESMLNGFGQWKTVIDGLDIHFLHVRSPERDALPVVMTHGWPGSVLEFHKVIGPLSDPARYGSDASDAFHLVLPSLPGHGFSDKPTSTGWGLQRIADAWAELMRRLGYGDRWAAQGGDWGAFVGNAIAAKGPAGCVGVHASLVAVRPTAAEVAEATPAEQVWLQRAKRYRSELSGYMKEQSTRPQTIGYPLADSPAGQAAWIYEKFRDWTDHGGRGVESLLTMDEMLDDIMLYWLPNSAASSARLYGEGFADMDAIGLSKVPMGFSLFPGDISGGSRRWAERRFGRVDYWNEVERGGHFAAFEQPEIFVREVRAALRGLR